MTKVTIEQINGRNCTVIRKPFDAEWVKEQLDMGLPVVGEILSDDGNIRKILHITSKLSHCESFGRVNQFHPACDFNFIKVTLPPLPRHPKPEDAPLLYRYMAEGLILKVGYEGYDIDYPFVGAFGEEVCFDNGVEYFWVYFDDIEITNATLNGECVNIALED